MLNGVVHVEGRCACMYYPYITAIHIPKYEYPRVNITGPHICMSVSMQHACGVHEGQVHLSMVAHIVFVPFS